MDVLGQLGFGAEIWLKVQGGTPPVPELDMSNLFFLDPYLSRQFLKFSLWLQHALKHDSRHSLLYENFSCAKNFFG